MKLKEFLRNPRAALAAKCKRGAWDLDDKLATYFNHRNGFFIETGAYDGSFQSNTYFLEKTQGWRGILVEPVPEFYRACIRNRPRAAIYNCALVSRQFDKESVTMHVANAMTLVDGALASDKQSKHLAAAVENQNLDGTYEIEAPARTLESILDEQEELPPIDFFSLDVEGYELQVLDGLNLDRYRPCFILVEVRELDKILSFMKGAGYVHLNKLTVHDHLFKDQSPASL